MASKPGPVAEGSSGDERCFRAAVLTLSPDEGVWKPIRGGERALDPLSVHVPARPTAPRTAGSTSTAVVFNVDGSGPALASFTLHRDMSAELLRSDFGCIFTPEANAVGFMVHGASDDGDGAAALVSALYDAAGIPPPADLHAPVGAAGNGTDHIDTATAADLPLPSAAVRKQRRGSDAGDGADAGGDTRAPNMAEETPVLHFAVDSPRFFAALAGFEQNLDGLQRYLTALSKTASSFTEHSRAQGRVGTRWGELMRKHRAASERTRGRQTRPSRRASDAGPGPHEEPESPVEEDEDDEDEDDEEDEEEIGDPTDDSAVAPVGANGGTHAAHAPKTSASGPSGAGSSGLRSFLGRKLGWRGAEAGGGQAQPGHSGQAHQHHHHHHHAAAAAAAALTGDRHAKEYVEADSPLPSDAADGWASDLGTLSDVLTRFGNVLDELEQARSIFHASLDATFVHPIERFVAEETSQALAMRKDAQRKRDEYLLAANRFASLKRTADVSTQVERQVEMQRARVRYEMARFDLVHQLNHLEAEKRIHLTESVCAAVYSFSTYFHQCHEMIRSLEPQVRRVQSELLDAKREFAARNKEWTARRTRLEAAFQEELLTTKVVIGEGSGAAEGKAEGVDPNARLSLYNHARRARAARRRVTRGHAASLEEGDQQLFDAEGEPIPEAAGAPTPLAHTVWDVTAESSRVLMHGYLFKRSTSVRKDWKRRWFFLRGGVLYYTRSHRDMRTVKVCSVMTANIRATHTVDRKHCFEVIVSSGRPYVLQAPTAGELSEWMTAFQAAREQVLFARRSRTSIVDGSESEGSAAGAAAPPGRGFPRRASTWELQPRLQRLQGLNSTCADCGSPRPEWLIINKGILVCIECSGIHRSLGVHISKVRSLKLDHIDSALEAAIAAVGNALANKVWEAEIPASWQRRQPVASSSRERKEAWIRAKYVEKLFVRPSRMTEEELNAELCRAVHEGDMYSAQLALARGAQPESARDAEGRSAMELALLTERGEMVEVLAQHGAERPQLDDA